MIGRCRHERGTVTAFVAAFTVALIAIGGLVVDGGYLLAERQRAFDLADAAARAGAQAIDVEALRGGGSVSVSQVDAQRRVDEYLAYNRHHGTVEIDGDEVTVHLSYEQPLTVLDAFGVGPVTIEATGVATAVQGVQDEDATP